jgi:hypothetical protein
MKKFFDLWEFEKSMEHFERIKSDFTPEDLKFIVDMDVAEKAVEEMQLSFAYFLAQNYNETKDEALKTLAEPILGALFDDGYKPYHVTAIGEWFLDGVNPLTGNNAIEETHL